MRKGVPVVLGAALVWMLSACGSSADVANVTETETVREEPEAMTDEDVPDQAAEKAAESTEESEEGTGEDEEIQALVAEGRDCFFALNGKQLDREKAFGLFSQAAEKDNAAANYYLGRYYEWRLDYKAARAAYEKAAEKDFPLAWLALGELHRQGYVVEGSDFHVAEACYKHVADDECPEVNYGWAKNGLTGGDDREKYLEKATEGEEPDWQAAAWADLGLRAIEKDNGDVAVQDLKKAYELSCAWTGYYAKLLYDESYSLKNLHSMDENEASEWEKIAVSLCEQFAGEGNVNEMYLLGLIKESQNKIQHDYKYNLGIMTEVIPCLERAGEAGSSDAWYELVRISFDLLCQDYNGYLHDRYFDYDETGIKDYDREETKESWLRYSEKYYQSAIDKAFAANALGTSARQLAEAAGRDNEEGYAEQALQWYRKSLDDEGSNRSASIARFVQGMVDNGLITSEDAKDFLN